MEGEVAVRDVMTREYVGVSEGDSVQGAVELMHEEGVGSAVVLRGSEPVGIVTESDVLALLAEGGEPAGTEVSSVMSRPVVSVRAGRELADAASTMTREDIRRLPVTRNGELVGVLSERDVISASASLPGVPSTRENSTAPPTGVAVDEPPGRASPEAERPAYSDGGICEECATLSRELSNVNGRLVCADCRDV